ncbi:MAG: sulfotransferase, partial [Alphaproteobacteria bacterium]
LHLFRGEAAQAAAHARQALAANPDCAAAHSILAQSGEDRDNQQALANIGAALDNTKIGSFDHASLYFTEAKRYGDSGDYGKEFESYIKGNEIKRGHLAEIGYLYDPSAVEHAVDEQIAAFGRDAFAQAGASDSEIPVFIVGMPRSGTSLIEQILASHPEVAGAGELMFLGEAVGRLRREADYPAAPPPALARDVANGFLERLARAGGDARRITDKMPSNFMHAGLIAMLFPGARIIHTRRDPADTCLSCFFQNFAGTSLAFSYDLADLGHYYRQYSRLMEHWRQCLPDRPGLLEVDYEKLVGHQERESRRLIEFLGLDWSDSCLSFHETKRVVTTASHSQVRQPVYRTSVGRWKRYGDRLAPLLKSLAG